MERPVFPGSLAREETCNAIEFEGGTIEPCLLECEGLPSLFKTVILVIVVVSTVNRKQF
jgi:hypothetical protein